MFRRYLRVKQIIPGGHSQVIVEMKILVPPRLSCHKSSRSVRPIGAAIVARADRCRTSVCGRAACGARDTPDRRERGESTERVTPAIIVFYNAC